MLKSSQDAHIEASGYISRALWKMYPTATTQQKAAKIMRNDFSELPAVLTDKNVTP